MKSNLIIAAISLVALASCSPIPNSDSGVSSDNGSSINENKSSTSKSEIEKFLIPKFNMNGDVYNFDSKTKLKEEDAKDLIGYLINTEDLEKWESIDNNSSLIYVLAGESALRYDAEDENTKNRFKISSTIYEDIVAIGEKDDCIAFKREN